MRWVLGAFICTVLALAVAAAAVGAYLAITLGGWPAAVVLAIGAIVAGGVAWELTR